DLIEELDELLVTVPRHALRDQPALQHVQRGEQRRRAVALVVVGHRGAPAGVDRQTLLGAVQRLDLTLLVDAEDQRVLRRVEVEADDIEQLLGEVGVVAHLEGAVQVRLQPVGAPDPADQSMIGPERLGEGARAPVGGVGGLLLGGHLDDPANEILALLGRSPAAMGILLDAHDARRGESVAPAATAPREMFSSAAMSLFSLPSAAASTTRALVTSRA